MPKFLISINFQVWHKGLLLLLTSVVALNLQAQNKLQGFYDDRTHQFIASDTGIIVNWHSDNGLEAFMIKGKNPFNYKTNKVGFIDTTGKIIIKPKYTNCTTFYNGFALVYDTLSQVALINSKGKIIIPFDKQYIRLCQNGLFELVDMNNRGISFVDRTNKTIVPFGKYFQNARPPIVYQQGDDVYEQKPFRWHPGLFNASVYFKKFIGVKTKTKWAVIDSTGREVIAPKFDFTGIFNEGLACVQIGKCYGVTDTAGNMIVPAEYDYLEITKSHFIIATESKKNGVLNTRNQLLVPFFYDHIKEANSNTFLVDTGDNYYKRTYGVLDNKNKVILPMKYRSVQVFGSGYIAERFNNNHNNNDAVFDSAGIQKTEWTQGGNLNYQMWQTNNGYIVYNKKKKLFVTYEDVEKLMYKRDTKWGMLDSAGSEVTPPVYNSFSKTLLKNGTIVENDKNFGIINDRGKELLPMVYNNITPINEDYVVVEKGNKYGLVNNRFKLATVIKFDRIDILSYAYYDPRKGYNNIRAMVDKKLGLLNYKGQDITAFKYDELNETGDGFYQVTIGKKYGLLDQAGVEISPCIYDSFVLPGLLPFYIVSKDGAYGLMDKKGKIVKPLIYAAIVERTIYHQRVYYAAYKGKVGIFDNKGKQIFPFLYSSAVAIDDYPRSSVPSNIKLPVKLLIVYDKGGFGVADTSGRVIVPLLYDYISTAFNVYNSPGINYIVIKNKKESILNEKGEPLIPFLYSSLRNFGDSLIIASDSSRSGVIDWKGRVIIPFAYYNISRTNGGYIVSNGKQGVLGFDGKEILHPNYDYINSCYCSTGVYFPRKGNKTGMADISGKMIVPMEYDSYDICGKKYVIFKKGKFVGLFDLKGKELYPCKYTYINCADDKVVEIY